MSLEASLTAKARALKAAGDLDAALDCYRQAVAAAPSSGAAEHNLAANLGNMELYPEAAEAVSRAIAKGHDAPETRLVSARAHEATEAEPRGKIVGERGRCQHWLRPLLVSVDALRQYVPIEPK